MSSNEANGGVAEVSQQPCTECCLQRDAQKMRDVIEVILRTEEDWWLDLTDPEFLANLITSEVYDDRRAYRFFENFLEDIRQRSMVVDPPPH